MYPTSVGVSGFVNDRKTDLDFLKTFQSNSESNPTSTKKRCLDRLRYRTKSFQPYKVRRLASVKRKVSTQKKLNRRQRRHLIIRNNSSELKSHVWQVKRMFMTRGKDYIAPSHSRKFGYKAVERFAEQRCVVHDMSYYRCIVIGGVENTVLEILSQFIVSCLHCLRIVFDSCGLGYALSTFHFVRDKVLLSQCRRNIC